MIFFLFEFKMDQHEAMEIPRKINNTYDLGNANKRTVRLGFTIAWKMYSNHSSEIGNNEMRNHWSSSSYNYKLSNNSSLVILYLFDIWSKLEKWRSSISGYLMSWLKIKKIKILKCCPFSFSATTTNFLPLLCTKKSGLHITTRDNHLNF